MIALAVLLRLHIPAAHTLKERRAVVRSLVDRLSNRFRVAVAEVGLQDRPQGALVGFAVVAADHTTARRVADDVLRFAEHELMGRAEIVASVSDEIALDERDASFEALFEL